MLRLGDGTEESQRGLQDAFEQIWGYRADFFAMTSLEQRLADHGIAVDRAALESAWNTSVDEVFKEAGLTRPSDDWKVTGGRLGRHTDHLGHMLSELQFLQRAYPGLAW